jgi:predicted transcriptional regulator
MRQPKSTTKVNVSLSIEKDIKEQLETLAHKNDRAVSAYIVHVLKQHLTEKI